MITGFVLIQVPLQVLLAKMFAVLRYMCGKVCTCSAVTGKWAVI